MALSEIEKLERRYAENPQGLTFAPLAEVHRKNGDVNRALELLRPGLQLHPDYIPASIVLGRCHLDMGDLPGAEAAFTHVLALDGENVIALKALADINERLHHFDQAERWLHQLLSIDRSNDDARDQLARIEAARAVASETAARSSLAEPAGAVAVAAEPATVAEPEPVAEAEPLAEAALLPEPEVVAEPARQEPPAWVSGVGDAEGAGAEPLALEDLEYTNLGAGAGEPPPEGLQVEAIEDRLTFEEPVEPVPGLVGRDAARSKPDEFMVETSEDIVLRSAGGSEFQVPDASQELFVSQTPLEPSAFGSEAATPGASREVVEPEPVIAEEGILEPEPIAEAEPLLEPEAIADSHAVAAPEPIAHSEPPESEPIAEPEPITEPEPIAEPEPVAELEPIAALEPERVDVESQHEPAATPARRVLTVDATNGESVATFFQRMLSRRLPAGTAPPAAAAQPASTLGSDASGAPTRPAADALSLSSVFGEDTSAHPPAVPASGAPAAGVSFDEFFSPPGAAQGTRTQRAQDAKSDDLDQFHAWLQNLKR